MCVLWGGLAFAGSVGTCDYSTHVNQAKADKANVEQKVATKPASQTAAEKLFLVQSDKMHQAVPAKKQ
jgi:hypothetical protein